MSQQTMHRSEQSEHPFVKQAKQFAREAGSSTDNGLINWAVRLQEAALAFGNTKRS